MQPDKDYIKNCVIFYDKVHLFKKEISNLYSARKPGSYLFIADEVEISEAKEWLLDAGVDETKGNVYKSDQFNFRLQVVNITKIIEALDNYVSKNKPTKLSPLLIFIDMAWAIRTPSGAIYLREYQAIIYDFSNRNHIVICSLFNKTIMLADQLMTAIQTHRHIVTSTEIITNPYFTDPSVFVIRNQHQHFNFWLNQIDSTVEKSGKETGSDITKDLKESLEVYNIDSPQLLIVNQSHQTRWKIRCLGELRVFRKDGTPINWNTKGGATKKIKTLFAYLLYKGEQGASVEEIVDILWPEETDLNYGLNRLYHVVRYLRQILSPDIEYHSQSPYLLNRNRKYFLAVPIDSWIDLPMFQELCFKGNAQLKKGDLTSAITSYQSAERLYKGDLLVGIPNKYIEDVENDWCWSRRYWYRDMFIKLLNETARIHRNLGNIVESLEYCDKSLKLDPFSEVANREKMKTLKQANRPDALRRQYTLYKKMLSKFEMGTPSPEITQLYLELTK